MDYRYRNDNEMRDSGIEWLGTIPQAWNLSKFKFISDLYTGNSIKDNEKDNYQDSNEAYPYIATKDINMNYNNVDYFNGMYTKVTDNNFRIAKKNSILLCIEGGSAGKKITYLNRNVSFVNKLCCINPININNKYQYYYCNSNSFLKEFNLNISGLIGGVSVGVLKNFIIAKPNIEEQEKIAKFLDEKTAKFDSIISKKEALIEKLEEAKKSLISEVVTGKVKVVKSYNGYELLERRKEEMKDSGVEWLGDIPKEWEVKKIKYISVLRSGDNITAERIEEEGIYPVYGGNGLRGYTNKYTHEGNYILIGRQGALCGNINYAYDKFWASEHAVVVNPILKVEILWLGELLRSMNLNQYSVSAAQPGLSVGMIENLRVPFVSLDEQKIISQFINKKNIEIDFVINKTKEQVEKLKEAKQSLISEAVTGKIEIL